MIIIIINYPNKIPKPPLVYTRIYSETNIGRFYDQLDSCNWNNILDTHYTELAFDKFYSKFTDIYENSFPLTVKSRSKRNNKPWMTKGLIKTCHTKSLMYKQYLKGQVSKIMYTQYRDAQKIFIRMAEENYYKDLFNKDLNGIKIMWKEIGTILNPKRGKSRAKIKKIDTKKGDFATSDQDIASIFNEHFTNIGNQLSNDLPSPKKHHKDFLKNPQENTFFFKPYTPNEIEKILKKLPKKKAPGMDNISNKAVQLAAPFIKKSLCHIVNLSISQGIFPSKLKMAKIIPIYKKGKHDLCSNYRPISLLSVFHKIIETCMKHRIKDFLKRYNILYTYQYGFRENHSTNYALLDVVEEIYKYLDNKMHGIGIFLDLQKAFDTISHKILIDKLEYYGIRGTILEWFKSYLTDRKQFTCINLTKSSELQVTCGVPQGSVLGPLLFILYVNDMENSFSAIKPRIFADDTSLFIFDQNIDTLYSKTNQELKYLEDWLLANKLSLNIGIDKETRYILFTHSKRNRANKLPNLNMMNANLPQAKSVRYLGITLDEQLSFHEHTKLVKERIRNYNGIIYHIRNKLSIYQLRQIYYAFIHSYIIYGVEIYGNAITRNLCSTLQIEQNRVLRTILRKDRYTPIDYLHSTLKILKIKDLIDFRILQTIYLALKFPEYLPQSITEIIESNPHTHNTRNKNPLRTYQTNTKYGNRTYKSTKSINWNNMPIHIQNADSIQSFKRLYTIWKLDSYKPTIFIPS